jgi:hypothetical protein
MTATGTRDGYTWQEHEGDMAALLAANPHVVEGLYLAITATDSPFQFPLPNGWRADGGILYTPRIETAEELRPALFSGGCCDGQYRFPEAYIFDDPITLSPLCEENVFEASVGPERVFRFVNFLGFRLSATDAMKDITDLLWTQIAWMRPRAYIAAGEGRAYLVTRNEEPA